MKRVKRSKLSTKLDQRVTTSPVVEQAAGVTGGLRLESEWHEQLAEDRASKVAIDAPGSHPVGATSSANSITADPLSRKKALSEPVPQVTRHI